MVSGVEGHVYRCAMPRMYYPFLPSFVLVCQVFQWEMSILVSCPQSLMTRLLWWIVHLTRHDIVPDSSPLCILWIRRVGWCSLTFRRTFKVASIIPVLFFFFFSSFFLSLLCYLLNDLRRLHCLDIGVAVVGVGIAAGMQQRWYQLLCWW